MSESPNHKGCLPIYFMFGDNPGYFSNQITWSQMQSMHSLDGAQSGQAKFE